MNFLFIEKILSVFYSALTKGGSLLDSRFFCAAVKVLRGIAMRSIVKDVAFTEREDIILLTGWQFHPAKLSIDFYWTFEVYF